MWNLKKQYKLTNRNRLKDIQDKLMLTKGEAGRDKREDGINRYTLSYINKDLLYIRGNYIQYLVIN